MNPIIKLTLLIAAILLATQAFHAQDLKHLNEIAHYRLIHSAQDQNGNLDSMELDNAPIIFNVGVYSNGIYPGSDPKTGSNIRTPHVSSLYDDEFAVVVIFRIEVLDGETRPIVILGQNDQYLGLEVRSDNKYAMVFNKTQHLVVPGLTADLNWHEVTIIHNQTTEHTVFWMDHNIIGEIDGALDRDDADGRITNVNNATAHSFLGYWSQLFIYGSEDISALHDILNSYINIAAFPNPVSDFLQLPSTYTNTMSWSVTNSAGAIVLRGDRASDQSSIDVSSLSPGIYVLQLRDSAKMVGRCRFVKN